MLPESARAALELYRRLGAQGMARYVPRKYTAETLNLLRPLLKRGIRILDVGCGYGRLSLPLAKEGWRIEGVDLCPNLIEAARGAAEERGLKIAFRVGDMRRLPYPAGGFGAVLCLWSTFNHLLTVADQRAAIGEMFRVLEPGGLAVIEAADGERPDLQRILAREGMGPDRRVMKKRLEGLRNPEYLHTRRTLTALAEGSPFAGHRLHRQEIAGHPRWMLRLEKAEG